MVDHLSRKICAWQRKVLDTLVRSNSNLGLDQRAECFVQKFAEDLPSQSTVLDIGGGWGFYSDPLRTRGHQHVVLDAVCPGFQKAPVVVYTPGEPFPFEDKSFDVSLLITVLHHIRDIPFVLREARRVTKSRVVVVEDLYHHALGRLWTQWRDQIYNFEFWGHPNQFRKRNDWVALFETHGFSLVRDEQVKTKLAGLSILNGLFVFDVKA